MISNDTAEKTGERNEAMSDFVLAHGLVMDAARPEPGGDDLAVARK
jgi:hypothetical protein